MAETPRYFRITIRNAEDSADELILSSFPDDEYPFITEAPSGDGQSIDPITGAATTGSYSVRIKDPEIDTDTRVLTSILADVNARQQLISRRAYVTQSEDGTTWDVLVPGYVLAIRLITAIEWEISVGETRRRESKREVFKTASTLFPGVTCVIGGPVIGGFDPLLVDHEIDGHTGWRFRVNQNNPGSVGVYNPYVQIKLQKGFDPRKFAGGFTSTSSAITNFTNDWARPYFVKSDDWTGASTPIQGHFPDLRVRLVPVVSTNVTEPVTLVPLSEPEPIVGPWYNPTPNGDELTRSGESSLWLDPSTGVDDNGDPIAFDPDEDDTFNVWVYALPISKENPMHVLMHPVELWEKLRLEAGYVAGVDYDDSNLAALTTLVGDDIRLMLRITESSKLVDFDRNVIYGPFRLSTRIQRNTGLLELFSISIVDNPDPSDTYTINDLRDAEDTVFNVDQDTVVTAVTLKQQRLRPWTKVETDQPEADALISSPWPENTLENAADDLPPGFENTVSIGDIPGMIMEIVTVDAVTAPQPVDFRTYLAPIADEVFQRFGRGAIGGTLHFRDTMTNEVGSEIFVDLIHRPNAVIGNTPVSQRGGARRVQIVRRTETPEGPDCEVVDSELEPV